MDETKDTAPQKILYIMPGKDTPSGDCVYSLVEDTGELLAQHVCSSASFAKGDLHDRRPERIAAWQEKYGDYIVRWIGEDEMTEAELLLRNHALADIYEAVRS